MLKWIASLIVLAVAGGGIYLTVIRGTGDSVENSGTSGSSGVGPGDDTPLEAPTGIGSGERTTGPEVAGRETVDGGVGVASNGGEVKVQPKHLTLLFVEQGTRKPVPNAFVLLLDRDTVDPLEWQKVFAEKKGLETYLFNKGQRLTADDNGVLIVDRMSNVALHARSKDAMRWADDQWMGQVPDDPRVIEMKPEIELQVQVLDDNDVPQAGIPVSVGYDDPSAVRPLITRQTVGLDGLATFKALRNILREGVGKGYAVSLGIPVAVPHLVPIQPGNLPDEPIELRLPPTGKLTLHVHDANGNVFPSMAPVALGRMVLEEDSGEMVFRPEITGRVQNGRAHFPRIGIGMNVVVKLSGVPEYREYLQEHAGPSTKDEHTEIHIEWASKHPVLVGRAVNQLGELLPNARGRYRFHQGDQATGGPPFIADESAEFRIVVQNEYIEGGTRTAKVQLFGKPGEAPLDATLDLSFHLESGDIDIGELPFYPRPTLITGIVRDGATGAFVERAHVRAQYRGEIDPETGDPTWTQVPEAVASSQVDGSFVLYGEHEEREMRLVASGRDYLNAYVEGLQAGQQNVEVVMTPGQEYPEGSGAARAGSGLGADHEKEDR